MEIFFNYDGDCFRVDSHIYHKGSPGKLYGPPETCYPAEPAEVEDVYLSKEDEDGNFIKLSDVEVDYLMSNHNFYGRLIEAVEDSYDVFEDDYED